ncbi:MAG: HEAT repeat domain-containing protein [Verrucomicrobiota bacterium]
MRTRKLRVILILVALLLVVGVVGYLSVPREPTYEGKSLGKWIEPFCQQTKTGIDAPGGLVNFEKLQPSRRAVAAMGTNALPFLIARLNHRESAIHRKLRLMLKNLKFSAYQLDAPQVEYIRAIRALANLGPVAQPTVLALTAHFRDPILAPHAAYALIAIGEDGVTALMQERTSLSPMLRMQIDGGLLAYGLNGEQATNDAAVRALVVGLSGIVADKSALTRSAAISRLSMMGSRASNAVPVLLTILEEQNPMLRQTVNHALGSIREPAELVIPALTNQLGSRDLAIRATAAAALNRIGYRVDWSFPSTPDNYISRDFSPFAPTILQPRARPIVPPSN